MTVDELEAAPGDTLARDTETSMNGTYNHPSTFVEIPKPDGGMRQLGIPMVASYCTSRSWVGNDINPVDA